MKSSRTYTNPDLTIAKLAEEIKSQPEYLSLVLNKRLSMNFFDFINSYRVEAFKEICRNPESKKQTLISLAFDCGFNSKPTFNRVFKKVTGLTPGEYYKTESKN